VDFKAIMAANGGLCACLPQAGWRGISIRPARYKSQLKIQNTIYNKMPLLNARPTEF